MCCKMENTDEPIRDTRKTNTERRTDLKNTDKRTQYGGWKPTSNFKSPHWTKGQWVAWQVQKWGEKAKGRIVKDIRRYQRKPLIGSAGSYSRIKVTSVGVDVELIVSKVIVWAIKGLELSGGWGTPQFMSTDAHFGWKSALNFNPWAKFQTFRQLIPQFF